MSSILIEFLDLTARHDVYPAIDPKGALAGSADGKVVLIAGASRGIGQATAVAFATAGARAVYLTARSEAALKETEALVRKANSGTQCAWSVSDVTVAAEVEAATSDCVARFGAIDVADANAGYLGPWVPIGELDPGRLVAELAGECSGRLPCDPLYAAPPHRFGRETRSKWSEWAGASDPRSSIGAQLPDAGRIG